MNSNTDNGEDGLKLRYLFFSIIPIVMIVLFVEGSTRIYFSIKYKSLHYLTYGSSHKETIYVYDRVLHVERDGYYKSIPGTYKQHYAMKEFPVRINIRGFRGKELRDTNYRIFCVGGSTTEGLEVEDGNDYPSCLQKLLGDRFDVVNAGFLGSSSEVIFNLISKDLLLYNPDAILFYEAFNDYHSIDDISPVTKRFRAIPKAFNILYSKSLLFSVLVEKKCLYTKRSYDKSILDHSIYEYDMNVRSIVELCLMNNVSVVLGKQGINIPGQDMTFRSIPIFHDNMSREELYYYLHYQTRKVLYQISGDYKIPIVDIHSALKTDMFYDIAHLTKEGNMTMASEFYKLMGGD